MKGVFVMIVALAGTAAAGPRPPLVETGFGPAEAGLQLALSIDGDAHAATFRVKNTGRAAVKLVESYTCSGNSPWSVSSGAHAEALDHQHALVGTPGTPCTRNVPKTWRTVVPGATVAITIAFADPAEVASTADRLFQGEAVIQLERQATLHTLHTPVHAR